MKLIIFDIDGTLTTTNGVDGDCLARVFGRHLGGITVGQNWENYPSFTDSGIAAHLWETNLDRPIELDECERLETEFLDLLRRVSAGRINPVPGAVDFFQLLLNAQEYAVAIATGSWRSSAEYKLEVGGIPFEGVPMASCNDANNRGEIMVCAKQRTMDRHGGREFEETIYFGDGVWDVRATNDLNWRMVGIGENIDRLRELGVADVFGDYCDPELVLNALRR